MTIAVSAPAPRLAQEAFNPFRLALEDDPYPAYRKLQECAPVCLLPSCLGRDWILSRYPDVQRVLAHPAIGADDLPQRGRRDAEAQGLSGETSGLFDLLDSWLFFRRGAEHKRLQQAVAKRFTPAEVERLRARIRASCQQLLAATTDEFDLMSAYARPLPALVSATMLGLSLENASQLATLSQELFSVFNQPTSSRRQATLAKVAGTLAAQCDRLLQARADSPRDDLASDLAQQVRGGSLALHEATALCVMLLSVGQDTSQHLLGNAVAALLAHPDSVERYMDEVEQRARAIKELARYDTPVQVVVHVAERPLQVERQLIEVGDRVHFFLGAANRDPHVFREPDQLMFGRPEISRLSFGAGPHFCLGAHLAQLTVEVALSELFARAPKLRHGSSRAVRIKSLHMRGYSFLPLQSA
jgi:cytochrome P450